MGLDTSHNAWHGPYSSFNRFRYWLAARIDINLDDYKGYEEKGSKYLTTINHPLVYLFNHSDCDGKIHPKKCKQIADGIDSVLKTITRAPENEYFYNHAIQFRDGCLSAFENNEHIDFH